MANIPIVDGNFKLEETSTSQTYTDTLYTNNKNISGDIEISITAKTGTAGTPVATKGTVSGNKVTVTPKVTNVEGWISSGTISGTGVTVTASELVSGSKSISSNSASIDVTNYQYVDVAVPTGITPTGTITLTQQTGTNVTNYASANVRAAGNFSLSATDNTGVVTVGSLASGYYPLTNSITASLSAGTPGWFSSGSANDSSVQVGKIAAATPSSEVSSLSSPTVAISGAVTGMTTATTSSYYVTVNGSATNGSVKSKYKNTQAGYAPANTGTESAATTITPNVTGSGTKIYIKAATTSKTDATASATITKAASASADITTTGFVTTNTNTGYKIEASASGGSGIAKAEVTGSSCSVSEGYSGGTSTSTSAKTATTTESTASDSKTVYIQKGVLNASGSASANTITVAPGNISIANDTTGVSGKVRITVTPTTATGTIDVYYIALKSTAAANSTGATTAISGSANAGVTTEGYVKSETATASISGTAKAVTSAKTSSVYYLPIKTSAMEVTSGKTPDFTVAFGEQVQFLDGYVGATWVIQGQNLLLEQRTVTPSTTVVTVTPSSSYDGLSKVTVEAVNPIVSGFGYNFAQLPTTQATSKKLEKNYVYIIFADITTSNGTIYFSASTTGSSTSRLLDTSSGMYKPANPILIFYDNSNSCWRVFFQRPGYTTAYEYTTSFQGKTANNLYIWGSMITTNKYLRITSLLTNISLS